jgi:hypothetical protein
MSQRSEPVTLETALGWARSGHEFDKVYRFIFLHPEDLFTIPKERSWPIAHQLVYHGNTKLLQQILALLSDDQINIRTLSKDKKTLLDVAKEGRTNHREMYDYLEHLFLQDDLIQAAEKSNWRLVIEILGKHPELANEKPPYSTYFLLHYVVKTGDKNILEDLLRRFQFQTNVLSADNEMPICLAKRLKKDDMCSLLEPAVTRDRSNSDLIRYRSLPPPSNNKDTTDKKSTSLGFTDASGGSSTASSSLPYPKTDPFPHLGFYNITIKIGDNGDFFFPTTDPSNPSQTETPPEQEHVSQTGTTVGSNLYPTLEPSTTTPVTPTTPLHLLKNITCSLTREIFVDPVIASDGQTYERAAIAEWVSLYHCSPTTGAPMHATLKDNTEMKTIIESMRTQS